jgi:peptidylprolyl isomerase
VAKGDLLVANYLGQIWRGKVFDNSYDRRRPAAFPIGLGQVIPGWDETLVGATIGSRVLLSIPPAKGYGSTGNPQAGIKGTDTLVFVVDLLGTYGKSAAGDAHATAQPPSAGLATVTGALGAPATVTVPHGLKPPSKLTVTPLAKGTGAAVKAGLLVIQYSAVNWSGKLLQSTWQTGRPEGTPVGDTASPSALDSLVGLPIGSRVLVELPAKDAKKAATDSDAIVVDIVAEPT